MRSFKTLFRINQALFFGNLALFALFFGAIAIFLFGGFSSKEIETHKIVLRNNQGGLAMALQADDQGAIMTFFDQNATARLQLQGGEFPALMMKSDVGEVVGTFFPLQEGGAGIGLGNEQGEMATFIRGGQAPGIGLYSHSQVPQVAMGISQSTPHFLLFPVQGTEGMVIDGSQTTSLLFFDQQGQVPVVLSRHGLYQNGKDPENVEKSIPSLPSKTLTKQLIEKSLKANARLSHLFEKSSLPKSNKQVSKAPSS